MTDHIIYSIAVTSPITLTEPLPALPEILPGSLVNNKQLDLPPLTKRPNNLRPERSSNPALQNAAQICQGEVSFGSSKISPVQVGHSRL